MQMEQRQKIWEEQEQQRQQQQKIQRQLQFFIDATNGDEYGQSQEKDNQLDVQLKLARSNSKIIDDTRVSDNIGLEISINSNSE